MLIADYSNAVHQLIGDALPVDYATDVIHACNGIEMPECTRRRR